MDGQGGRQRRQSGWKRLVALGMVAVLAACGGGGAEESAPPAATHVKGAISADGAGEGVVLVLNAAGAMQEASVAADGRFGFADPVSGGYSVQVKAAPAGLGCAVSQAEATADTQDVRVECTATKYRLSGKATGLSGPVGLRNVGAESLTVQANGAFSFTQSLAHGASYNVQVVDAGAGQICGVANGAGMATGDVSNLQLSCTAVVVPPPPPAAVPGIPASLTMTYGIKRFNFSWAAVAAATSYRLLEDPDGPLGPLPATVLASNLVANTASYSVATRLHEKVSAAYSVQACNADGCGTATAAVSPNLNQAVGYFKASNTGAQDNFGTVVALSGDGNTLAVSALGESSSATGVNGNQADNNANSAGAVYVFTRAASGWTQQAYIKASNTQADDGFGFFLALSSDGNTLAVSATGEDSSATGVNGNQADNNAPNSGAVYVFTRSGNTWAQQAYVKASNTQAGDSFGFALALSGDGNTLAVGASEEDSSATGINGNPADNSAANSGAAYVFTRFAGAWAQQAYVKASNTNASDRFGLSLALSGNGDTLAVGAVNEASNATGVNGNQTDNSMSGAGAAYVFVRNAGIWFQQAYVKASNTEAGDRFGWSVALSGDGQTLAVGADGEASASTGVGGNQQNNGALDAGAVYVFARNAQAWTQQAYVKASNAEAGDVFGRSVALSANGNVLAVGADAEDGAGPFRGTQADNSTANSGAVYVFVRTAGVWANNAHVIKSSNTDANDKFGLSVSLSADGNSLAVGAFAEDSAAQGIGGDASNNAAANAGAVYLY